MLKQARKRWWPSFGKVVGGFTLDTLVKNFAVFY